MNTDCNCGNTLILYLQKPTWRLYSFRGYTSWNKTIGGAKVHLTVEITSLVSRDGDAHAHCAPGIKVVSMTRKSRNLNLEWEIKTLALRA